MSDEQGQEQQNNKKPAVPPEQDEAPGSKSYAELLKGFAEIGRLQANQEEFERRDKDSGSVQKKEKKTEEKEPAD